MRRPVIAIGLDAATSPLIERWMAAGLLPTLAGLRARGAYAPLRGYPHHTAETVWTTFHTGCPPPTVGYWSPVHFRDGTYDLEEVGAYDYQAYPPFYALGQDYRVAIFDAPQTRLSEGVNGLQILAWGAHSPQTDSASSPAGLLEELTARHGPDPTLRQDWACIYDPDSILRLKQGLETGIARRSLISQDLVQRERWDLFLTVFDCFHSAGHVFWHLSDPDHPLHARFAGRFQREPLQDLFIASDRAIGEIIAKAPSDASVVVFSTHGMETNVLDLSSIVLLPELMYRFSFPGHTALAPGRSDVRPPPPDTGRRVVQENWSRALWSLTREGGAAKSFLKRTLRTRYSRRLEFLFGKPADTDPLSPFRFGAPKWLDRAQPATWFQHLWPRMKAFALPSFSEGYIRINLQGREPEGIVPAADYDRLCDELIALLSRTTDARTGQSVVREVVRTRQDPMARDPRLPAADLVVRWNHQRPADVFDSPLGRVGPVPFLRTGGHNADGFLIARGPGIPVGVTLPEGRTVDIPATLLGLMSAPIPAHMEGRPLVPPARRGSGARQVVTRSA